MNFCLNQSTPVWQLPVTNSKRDDFSIYHVSNLSKSWINFCLNQSAPVWQLPVTNFKRSDISVHHALNWSKSWINFCLNQSTPVWQLPVTNFQRGDIWIHRVLNLSQSGMNSRLNKSTPALSICLERTRWPVQENPTTHLHRLALGYLLPRLDGAPFLGLQVLVEDAAGVAPLLHHFVVVLLRDVDCLLYKASALGADHRLDRLHTSVSRRLWFHWTSNWTL